VAPEAPGLPPPGIFTQLLGVPGRVLKSIEIPASLQVPQKSEKVTPRLPKDPKMRPQIAHQDTNIVNKWKKRNPAITIVFTAVSAHAATGFRQHFHPWIIKNMDLEPACYFDTSNHRQISKMSPTWVPGGSQSPP